MDGSVKVSKELKHETQASKKRWVGVALFFFFFWGFVLYDFCFEVYGFVGSFGWFEAVSFCILCYVAFMGFFSSFFFFPVGFIEGWFRRLWLQ